jgi:hypothetical protein
MTLQKYLHRPSEVSRYCHCLYRAESREASSSGFRGGLWARVTQQPPAHHPSTGCLDTGFHQITVSQSERLQGRLHRATSGAASSLGVKGGFILLLI